MAEFFLEVLSEEIPARMQYEAEKRLCILLRDAIVAEGLGDSESLDIKSWSGPRRLAVSINGVADKQADIDEERRGPREGADARAIEGFCKSAGVSRDALELRETGKGKFYFARISKKGVAAKDVLPAIIARLFNELAWPKTMRWGTGEKSWVRPVRGIVALLDGAPIKGAVDFGGGVSIAFSNKTRGHRIMTDDKEITITGKKDYAAKLAKAFVIASRDERKEMIEKQLQAAASKRKIKLRDDDALLDEVAGLVEFPNVILGDIDKGFMSLPPEILTASMRTQQKYFAFESKGGELAPCFATVANMQAESMRDDIIRKGNERVLSARLTDARFFWDADCKTGLDAMAGKLGEITFLGRLGTMEDKARRIGVIAGKLGTQFGYDRASLSTAAKFAKADLVSQSVGEFPELQGFLGGYLAQEQGLGKEVARAISEHYYPIGLRGILPNTKIGSTIALADKIDTLVGFFGISEFPTGSKDPFGLRRAAIGIMDIIIHGKYTLPLRQIFDYAAFAYKEVDSLTVTNEMFDRLLSFFHDRLKSQLREANFKHDAIAAVIRKDAPRADDILHLFRLARELDWFLASEDGVALMAGYKRATSILAAEEKKDGKRYEVKAEDFVLHDNAEKTETALHNAIGKIAAMPQATTDEIIAKMQSLATLRAPIDAFFDEVIVNHADENIRRNRLYLLDMIRTEMKKIADFSAIEG